MDNANPKAELALATVCRRGADTRPLTDEMKRRWMGSFLVILFPITTSTR